RPRPDEDLPQEVLRAAVEVRGPDVGRGLAQPAHERQPLLGVLRQHPDAGADVLPTLGVVGAARRHRRRVRVDGLGDPRVQLVDADAEAAGRAADLAQAHEVGPPVVGGVLHALGHDGAAGLLEADDELGAAGVLGTAGAADLVAQDEVDDDVQRLVTVLVQPGARLLGGLTYPALAP